MMTLLRENEKSQKVAKIVVLTLRFILKDTLES